jgi:vesicle-fusing ATPase
MIFCLFYCKYSINQSIGKILKSKEPKIVNGPEILDKYVGAAEEKIRNLFADAEKEQAEKGDSSQLHIIIFDEMDAIMKQRGSNRGDSGVGDSIVNQLLSKIDGVDSLNNILIIGMTNRKDMIDEAILRPGRLEVHVEIALPDERGRLQILRIKTADMVKNNRVTAEAAQRLPEIAEQAKNFTGAELEGLVRNAASFALSRHLDPANLQQVDTKSIRVEFADFERALLESKPAFGNANMSNDKYLAPLFSNGIVDYGDGYRDLKQRLDRMVKQVQTSTRTPLMSVLLEGAAGCGKSAIAAKLALDSQYPYVRMISPDMFIGDTDSSKASKLLKIFTDAYKSPLSLLFINDIERLIEFTPVGMRFSNVVLQTLLVLLRKTPPHPSRMLIIGTTSVADLLQDLQLTSSFTVQLHVSMLQQPIEYARVLTEYANPALLSSRTIDEISRSIAKPLGVKTLLLALEMAQADCEAEGTMSKVTVQGFLDCLITLGA